MARHTKKKPVDSRAAMIRKLSVGILTREESGSLPLTKLKSAIEGLLLEKIRSDFLQTTLRQEPRVELVEKEGHLVANLVQQNGPSATVEEFVMKALDTLPTEQYPDRFHVVFSGFNRAFREFFPGLDPVKEVEKIAATGKIRTYVCKGGAMIARPSPPDKKSPGIVIPKAGEVLSKMGLTK